MGSRKPSTYHRVGHPFDGLPQSVIEAITLQQHSVVIGNGNYSGPLTVAAGATLGGWVMTDTGTGTGLVAVNNVGRVIVTAGNGTPTDEDQTQIQKVDRPFRYATTVPLTFFARLQVSSAALTDAFIGLSIVDTTLIATSAEGVTDCIGFFKGATATDFSFLVQKNGTATTTACGLTIVSAQDVIVGFTVRAGVIRMFAAQDTSDTFLTNTTLIGAGTVIANTNAPDDEDIFFSVGAGVETTGTAKSVSVDWAFAVQGHA